MIYPAQTSLIPTQIALARFLEQGGHILGQYPYWYSGVPFRYLAGPILIPLLALLHRLLPNFSLFEIMFGMIAASWVIGGAGVYLLIRKIENISKIRDKRAMAGSVALLYLFGPLVPFLFPFANGLSLISFSILPYVLLFYFRFLQELEEKRSGGRNRLALILLISFLFLLDISSLPILFLGIMVAFLAQTSWKRVEQKLKQTFLVLLFSFLISTMWYTSGYWLRVLSAPSLAGKGVFSVVTLLTQLLPVAMALTMAVFSSKLIKSKQLVFKFCFYWLFIFGFLTLMRFIADPDFILDWSMYGTEIQLGLALAGGIIIDRILGKNKKQETKKSTSLILIFVFGLWLSIFYFIFDKYVLGTLQRDITRTVEYRVDQELHRIAKPSERVFLSGTTAFWLNAFFDLSQVRGGKDELAPHPLWDQAVWEIREGSRPERTLEVLRELGVSYLVVHSKESEEYYHDFSHPEKLEGISALEKIYQEKGDLIYRVLD